jgi:MFS family permease
MSRPPEVAGPAGSGRFSRALLALILGQISLHACMAGLRMATPLQALRDGHGQWAVGILLALFALAPVALAMPAGRLADRLGYHRPLQLAVALSFSGGLVALIGNHYQAACIAASLAGAGANVGLIVIQRTAGHMAADSTERIRIFSWLGLAPALSNVLGPLAAGVLIDLQGFRAAYAALALMPLAALAFARFVPDDRPAPAAQPASDVPSLAPVPGAWSLLRLPALRRLLLVNWLISASWDVHTFVLPILGHERGLSASAIGAILGIFAAAVAGVRLLIPLLAHRLGHAEVLFGAMLCAALVFGVYPLMGTAWGMGACAVVLGMALGSVQPMVMSALHQVTPADRHGEAIALRSVAINLSSTVMPLVFGLAGGVLGSASLFWLVGLAVGTGSWRARRL